MNPFNGITDIITAVDPGTTKSAYVLYDAEKYSILDKGHIANREMLDLLAMGTHISGFMALETVKSFGNMGGDSLYLTCMWIGRFISAWLTHHDPHTYTLLPRKTVVTHLCGSSRAGDSHVRRVLIDFFTDNGRKGEGRIPIIGTKKKPGTLYGVSGDMWSALGLAVFWATIPEKDKAVIRTVLA